MLTSFAVSGFKSIRDEARLDLAPLTVVVGANSSGKSSLLQAFLLLSQSVQLPSADLILDFNGLFLNLGTVQEVQSRPGARTLKFSCGFTVPESRRRVMQPFDATFLPKTASYALSLSTADDPPGRTARVDDFELTVRDASDQKAVLLAHRRRGGFPPTPHLPSIEGRPTLLASQQYRVGIDFSPERPVAPGFEQGPVSGVELAGPLPTAVWRTFDSITRSVGLSLRSLLLQTAARVTVRGDEPSVARLTLDFWHQPEVEQFLGRAPDNLAEARRQLAGLPPTNRTRARSLVDEYLQKLSTQVEPQWSFERQPLPSNLGISIDELRERLSSVYYLGPLRAAPRPLYAAAAGASQKSVGREGEFTAAVLHRYGEEKISYAWQNEIVSGSLLEATSRWMQYMDLHAGAIAHDYGRLGHDLLIEDSVAGELDLTQVGVGVSQALPVIIQCLVAPPGSVIVLEQPELHLHPRVQSRLADFLTAIAAADRTVICETHSEYLVSRLRIRTGREELHYGRDFKLYFTSRQDGVTLLEEVPVEGKGRLAHWPMGFFDQSAEDASDLLQVQLAK